MIERHDPARARDLLHELDALRIILPLGLLVVRKRGVLHRLPEVLEAGSVECDRVLLAPKVLDWDVGVSLADPVLVANTCLGVGVDESVRFGAVRRRLEIDEFSGRDGSHGVREGIAAPVMCVLITWLVVHETRLLRECLFESVVRM